MNRNTIISEMKKSCIYCGSKNTFQIDTIKEVIACFDCYGVVSNPGKYISLIYIANDLKETLCVREAFDSIYPDSELKEIVGLFVITKKMHEIDAYTLSKVMKYDCVLLNKLSLTLNSVVVSPKCISSDSKLMDFGVTQITQNESVSFSIIGNALDGESILKLIGYLIVSGCKEIRFT
jgi:hypothetical protein